MRLFLIAALAALWAPAALAQDLHPAFDPVTAALRAGDYKQVTSVLVARHGQVIYEQYFDEGQSGGGAAALRNTRSATKTMTGMLVGAAADRGLLSPQAHVLDYFRDRLPRSVRREAAE